MALFVKQTQAGFGTQFYTLGQNKTVLVAGLGNIGKEYIGTRHNAGFLCADAFVAAQGFDGWIEKKDLRCYFSSGRLGDTRVLAIKPTTLMNLSGEAVGAAARFYKVQPEQIVVVHDELDVPFGAIRTRVGGGSAGHNGLKSIIQHLGTEAFGRVRVGIGPKTPQQIDSADFVLAHFSASEQTQLKNLTQETNAILSEYVLNGQLPHETREFIV